MNIVNKYKFLSALIGILFCPVTILALLTIWTGPIDNSNINTMEEIKP